ncbi:MAG TPA: hypothetical protein VMQ10_14750 [Spirochaetia bacterium]|nr:hypothetical protein [Spirochaetia bacterium]
MRRWSFVIGAALVLLGILSILNAVLGVSLHIFWPIVLIAIGAWIILGISRGRPFGGPASDREQASVPLDGARQAAVTVHHGAGRLSIGSGAAGDLLASGTFGGGLEVSRRAEGDRLVADLRVRDRDPSRWFFGAWRGGWAGVLDWDLDLNPSVPLSLRVEAGASETRLSLQGLQVRELLLKTGASSTTVDLPERAGHTRVTVESGAASVRIRVPATVAASIVVRSTLAGVRVNTTRFPGSTGVYRSPNFDTAENKAEIFVDTAVASVEIS